MKIWLLLPFFKLVGGMSIFAHFDHFWPTSNQPRGSVEDTKWPTDGFPLLYLPHTVPKHLKSFCKWYLEDPEHANVLWQNSWSKVTKFSILCSIQGPKKYKTIVWDSKMIFLVREEYVLCFEQQKGLMFTDLMDRNWPKPQKSTKMLIQGPVAS